MSLVGPPGWLDPQSKCPRTVGRWSNRPAKRFRRRVRPSRGGSNCPRIFRLEGQPPRVSNHPLTPVLSAFSGGARHFRRWVHPSRGGSNCSAGQLDSWTPGLTVLGYLDRVSNCPWSPTILQHLPHPCIRNTAVCLDSAYTVGIYHFQNSTQPFNYQTERMWYSGGDLPQIAFCCSQDSYI